VPVLSSCECDHAALPRISDTSIPHKCLVSGKKSIEQLHPSAPRQTSALELSVFCCFCILLVYPCALYCGICHMRMELVLPPYVQSDGVCAFLRLIVHWWYLARSCVEKSLLSVANFEQVWKWQISVILSCLGNAQQVSWEAYYVPSRQWVRVSSSSCLLFCYRGLQNKAQTEGTSAWEKVRQWKYLWRFDLFIWVC